VEERRPSQIQWRDFVRLLDAGLFLAFLIDELEQRLPDFAAALATRIGNTWSEVVVEQFEDLGVPANEALDPVAEYLMELEADVAERSAPENAMYHLRGLAVVSLHSALDTYARAVLPDRRKAAVPEFIDDSLRRANQPPLERKLYNSLVEFDATRHLIVHNHGLVTGAYVSRVIDNPFVVGEPRPLDGSILLRYARIAWYAGLLVHQTVEYGDDTAGRDLTSG